MVVRLVLRSIQDSCVASIRNLKLTASIQKISASISKIYLPGKYMELFPVSPYQLNKIVRFGERERELSSR